MDGEFFLPLAVVKLPDFGGAIDKGCHKAFSIGTELGNCHREPGMLDGDFFLPSVVVLKPPNFGGNLIRGCHKVFSIGAEARFYQRCSMLDSDFSPPLIVLKPPD